MTPRTEPVVLDTSILVALIRASTIGRRIDADHGLRERPDRPIISIVTVGELKSLVRKLGWGAENRRRVDELVAELTVIHLEQGDILDRHAELDHFSEKLVRPAKRMGKNDLWIAATAAAIDAHLLTSDRDFDHLAPRFLKLVPIDPETGASTP